MIGHLLNILMEYDLIILMIFGVTETYNFDPYNVLLSIATNTLLLCSRDTLCLNTKVLFKTQPDTAENTLKHFINISNQLNIT